MAATPSPNYNDQQLLAGEPGFMARCRQAMFNLCIGVATTTTGTNWRERQIFAVGFNNAPDSYKTTVAQMVACNSTVMSDATVNGTVPLTSGNVAAQGALVQDTHIDTVLTSNFNCFFRTPGF
jgi:hypothetical protein